MLTVTDLDRSVAFYRDALGMGEEQFRAADGTLRDAELRLLEEIRHELNVDRLHAALGGEAVGVTRVGLHQMWASQYWRLTRPRNWMSSGGSYKTKKDRVKISPMGNSLIYSRNPCTPRGIPIPGR